MDAARKAVKRRRESLEEKKDAQEAEIAKCRVRHFDELESIRAAHAPSLKEKELEFERAQKTLRGLQKTLHRGWMRKFVDTTEIFPAMRLPIRSEFNEIQEFECALPVGCNWCMIRVTLPLNITWRMDGRDPHDMRPDESTAHIETRTDYSKSPSRECLDTRNCKEDSYVGLVQAHRTLEGLCVKDTPWMDYVDKARLKDMTEKLILEHKDSLAEDWFEYCDGEPSYDGDWDDDVWSNSEQEASMAFYVCIPPEKVALHLKPGKHLPAMVGEGAPLLPSEGRNFTDWNRCYRSFWEEKYMEAAFSASDGEGEEDEATS